MSGNTKRKPGSLFEMNGIPPMGQVIPLGLQHVVAAIVGVVTPALIISGSDVCDLSPEQRTMLVQVSLIITALATFIQLFPIGRVGAGLPVIMGVSFAYLPTLRAIGASFDLATIFGAQIVGGIVAILFGVFVKQLRVFFPPLVTGTVIFTIGLSLYSTAVRYMAGGGNLETNPMFGSWQNWLVAGLTLVVVVFFNHFTKGTAKLAAILIGMTVGYIVAFPLGLVDLSPIGQAAHFQLVAPMAFGIKFEASACISMAVMYMVNAVQTIGDLSSTTLGGLDRNPTDRELSGGIVSQGLAGVTGALIGGLPTASYSQNVGIVTVNRVVNKAVFAFAAGLMLVAGFLPKFASALTTIPQCVIGGATISVFATITMTGIRMITADPLTPRNVAVVGLAVALGVGVTSVPGCLAGFPDWVTTVFGSSSVVLSTLAAILLNLILPHPEEKNEEKNNASASA